MESLIPILIVVAIISLVLGIVKKLFHLAIIAGIVLVVLAIIDGVIPLAALWLL